MNKQRKVLITTTYNEMGIIIDTKTEKVQLATDTISRQVAIDVLHEYFDTMLDTDTVCPADIYGLLETMPTAQPERKKGHWISLDDGRGRYNEFGYKCSECGEQSDYEENYCPNCGVEMIGDNNGGPD